MPSFVSLGAEETVPSGWNWSAAPRGPLETFSVNLSHFPAMSKLHVHLPGLRDLTGLRIGLVQKHCCPCPGTMGASPPHGAC